MNRPGRHALVWPTAAGWSRVSEDAHDDGARRAVDLWRTHGWPLVVRRYDISEIARPGEIALGLPLPPAQGKRRLRFRLTASDVVRTAAPLQLHEVVTALPPAWARAVAALVDRARDVDVPLQVFGSAAWHALTGLAYLRDDSDLDVIARPCDATDIERTTTLLGEWERHEMRRADGEFVFADGAAVSWREWLTPAASVLVKDLDGVSLQRRDQVLARLDHALAAS